MLDDADGNYIRLQGARSRYQWCHVLSVEPCKETLEASQHEDG